jgi:hypothetical protein
MATCSNNGLFGDSTTENRNERNTSRLMATCSNNGLFGDSTTENRNERNTCHQD